MAESEDNTKMYRVTMMEKRVKTVKAQSEQAAKNAALGSRSREQVFIHHTDDLSQSEDESYS